jgi:transposase
MDVSEREPGDRQRLDELIRAEKNAKQRDRLRMVRLALDGEEKLRIAEILGVAKSTVETWVYRYRDRGLDAVRPIKQPGAPCRLSDDQKAALRARVDAGPLEEDGVCAFSGPVVRRIIEREFGVKYSVTQAYEILHALGFERLSPRPRHENQDAEAQGRFREATPFFSGR